jgi:hypothetical protein
VSEVVADWPLLRPADADELLDLLQKGRFRSGTVLWLNETQRYLDSIPGGRAASLLRSTLAATDGAVAVGALWSHPYLEKLTAAGNSPDLHAAARALIDGPRTRRITVPKRLDSHQQQELAALAGSDKRLAAALAASGPDGDVIQHLTGGPELLHAYIHGELFTPVERALITAALDTRRLGHEGPIPAALLAIAADGYLSPRQRPGHTDWATSALTGLTIGSRPDGSRIDIRHTLTALKALRARSGDIETSYEPDDYLDQHTRQLRQACLDPRQLWDALIEHTTDPDDLYRLGHAAYNRGLYRYAALLWKNVITAAGNARAAADLIKLLLGFDRDGAHDAYRWVSEHVFVDDSFGVGELLDLGSGAAWGASQEVRQMLLLDYLGTDSAAEAASALAARAAKDAPLNAPDGVAWLLGVLPDAEVSTLLARRPDQHAVLDDLFGVARLLRELHYAGAAGAVSSLAARAARDAPLDNISGSTAAEDELGDTLGEDFSGVAGLLREMRDVGAAEAASTLAARAARDAPWMIPGKSLYGGSRTITASTRSSTGCSSTSTSAGVMM